MAARRLPARLHRDQRGTISIVSVFAVMLLAMLLGMVMNVGRQVEGKIRMQNAADAAAYSGGVVLARGMNTLAFSNHLLSDVFALTAFMREAQQRNAEQSVPEILAAWTEVADRLRGSGIPKFVALGQAIAQKVPLEQNLVTAYSDWAAASSERILPLLEEILAEELIPQYQRAVVAAFPDVAQMATLEIARRNGLPEHGRGPMLGVLWRASGQPVGGEGEWFDPTFPVVDPVMDNSVDREKYILTARGQRNALASRYLNEWNREAMYVFDREAKMSQFGRLWRSFTCGQLERLVEEHRQSNLPHVIRTNWDGNGYGNGLLEENFTFIAVVYWGKLPEILPGLFRNPIGGGPGDGGPGDSDSGDGDPGDGDEVRLLAFAEVRLFVPRRRLVWSYVRPHRPSVPIGGVPGEFLNLPGSDDPRPVDGTGEGRWIVARQSRPAQWDLLNQNWTCKLVPATQASLHAILQTSPPPWLVDGEEIELPDLSGLTPEDIRRISAH